MGGIELIDRLDEDDRTRFRLDIEGPWTRASCKHCRRVRAGIRWH